MKKQRVDGLMPLTLNFVASDGDYAKLDALMAGEVETFKLIGQGGTAIPMPEILNRKSFIVGRKNPSGSRISTMVTIPHIKLSKTFNDISTSVIGTFGVSYEPADQLKSEYANLKFDA